MPDKLIGAILDQYELLVLLAEGPVANIYRGRQISIERPVVVKVYPRKLLRGRGAMDDFRQDAAVIARLEHINIVPMYAFGEHDGHPYIVQRYYEGGSLENLVQPGAPLPSGNTAHIVQQIGGALNYVHRQGVTHRNVKASNILLDSTGTAYLSDFTFESINRALAGRGRTPIIGNPTTMAPEQATDALPSPAMDVYALGVVTFQMLAGGLPYVGDTPAALVEQHLSAPVPALMDVNPNIPAPVNAVVARAMAKHPEERYRTTLELSNALQQAIDEAGVEDVTPFETLMMETLAVPDMAEDIGATVRVEEEPPDVMPVPEATIPHPEPARAEVTIPARSARAGIPAPARTAYAERPVPARRGSLLLPIVTAAALLLIVAGVGGSLLVASQMAGGGGTLAQSATLPPTPNLLTRTPQLPTQQLKPTIAPAEAAEAPLVPADTAKTPVTDLPSEVDQFGVPMVLVPAGSFMMGNPDLPDQRPVHEVFLDAFYIDKYEVPNAELKACVDDDVCAPHTETTAPGIFGYFGVDYYAHYPAIYVSWEAAVEYCQWREARLPTEAEWEKAARWDPQTGETFQYPWGNAFPDPRFANYYESGIGRAVEVDQYPEGASPVGAFNMSGNVKEWVADWYDKDYYDVSPAENPQGPETGQLKVLRGASFDVTSGGVIPTTRWQQTPNFTAVDFGFRCALTP